MNTGSSLYKLEIELYVLIMLLVILVSIITIVLTFLFAKKKPGYESILSKLKTEVKLIGDRLWLGRVYEIEHGIAVYNRVPTPYGTFYSYVKWIGRKDFTRTDEIYLREVCLKPPVVIKPGSSLFIEVPAVRLASADLKNMLIICFNTRGVKAKANTNLIYTDGFARVDVTINKGVIRTRAEWAIMGSSMSKGELSGNTLTVELCHEKYRECVKLLELTKPGVSEDVFKFPEIYKVVYAHRYGTGFQELVDLVKDVPPVFSIENTIIKVFVKKWLRKIAEVEAKLEAY